MSERRQCIPDFDEKFFDDNSLAGRTDAAHASASGGDYQQGERHRSTSQRAGPTPRPGATIIISYTRPSLTIRGDDFDPDEHAAWAAELTAARAALRRAITCVGRLQSPDLGPMPGLGTAWLVRPDLAVTNRHVTGMFAAKLRGGSAAVTLELVAERGAIESRVRQVLAVVYEADDHDLAFVRLAPQVAPSPSLTLSPHAAPGDRVAAIGYPSNSVGHYDPAQIERMFGDHFDIKRLAPGALTAVSSARVDHDCTTLGGNSGSPLVSLGSGAVVGVHYGGEGRFLVNWAVPAPVVAERLAGLVP